MLLMMGYVELMKPNSSVLDLVQAYLQNNDLEAEARQLTELFERLTETSEQEREGAYATIVNMCGPRALGDLKLDDIGGNEWNALLERLITKARRKKNKI